MQLINLFFHQLRALFRPRDKIATDKATIDVVLYGEYSQAAAVIRKAWLANKIDTPTALHNFRQYQLARRTEAEETEPEANMQEDTPCD